MHLWILPTWGESPCRLLLWNLLDPLLNPHPGFFLQVSRTPWKSPFGFPLGSQVRRRGQRSGGLVPFTGANPVDASTGRIQGRSSLQGRLGKSVSHGGGLNQTNRLAQVQRRQGPQATILNGRA